MSAPTPKGSRRRAELLDAAERVLAAGGGAELTMRAVAGEAGVRLGHLQYYFPGRPDLLAALLERVLTGALERVAALAGADAEQRPAAGDVLDAVLLADHDDPRLVRVFTEIWAMAAREEPAAAAVRGFYDAYAGHVAEYIARGAPGVPASVCRARAETLVMLVEGAALMRSGVAGVRSAATDAEVRRVALSLLAPG
ncbi:TetR family transcriptional regulator [Streptomyces bambusae]|uniref:TetR/AcrR family transcriptional regulator n=1 Tax=Streptomyces bambusae TaxID=1550616 RepID=UPI001CFD87C5|nr:TetR family transcriptional regulator [Streptomyces bambusae]MCB5164300.1 TetR family transcriptional regulator [Streptomyces bambusae]